ncbi:hypothetical protein EN871_05320 [bacterium M00.F.Ca.ET.228.01.1.1]|nr:hypothetical protein EN871_05320 [bacterium M00.F.Ca.ET.228.01.1.1]TGS04201.1 hypothetical protein EN834_07665 [bacterium M00.F.Ca.ET.191.01.1.1]TGU07179.1 hypothetical protein EN798_09395 [bacterium M00.F.Ca.ET.155.01.1.1]
MRIRTRVCCPHLAAGLIALTRYFSASNAPLPDDGVISSNSALRFSLIQFTFLWRRLASNNKWLLGCGMLAVFFIACPICIAALFGFARHVDPQTGHFKR